MDHQISSRPGQCDVQATHRLQNRPIDGLLMDLLNFRGTSLFGIPTRYFRHWQGRLRRCSAGDIWQMTKLPGKIRDHQPTEFKPLGLVNVHHHDAITTWILHRQRSDDASQFAGTTRHRWIGFERLNRLHKLT